MGTLSATGRLINTSMSPGREIYHQFEARGLTHSRRHFSREWLGAAENYTVLRADRGPSADVLIGLFQKVWREGRLGLAVWLAWMILWMSPEARR